MPHEPQNQLHSLSLHRDDGLVVMKASMTQKMTRWQKTVCYACLMLMGVVAVTQDQMRRPNPPKGRYGASKVLDSDKGSE